MKLDQQLIFYLQKGGGGAVKGLPRNPCSQCRRFLETPFKGDSECGCGEAPESAGKKKTLDESLLLLRSPKVNTTTATLG